MANVTSRTVFILENPHDLVEDQDGASGLLAEVQLVAIILGSTLLQTCTELIMSVLF